MNITKRMAIYFVIGIIILIMACLFFTQLNLSSPVQAPAIPAGEVTVPAEEAQPSLGPSIPVINPLPGYEEVTKNIKEESDRQDRLAEKIVERDKRAAVVRAEIISKQDELLSAETKGKGQQVIIPQPEQTGSTEKSFKQGLLSGDTKRKVLPNGYFVGH